MTLFLTSSGINEELKDTFLSHLPKLPQDISVAYITTAAFGEEGNKLWMYAAKKQLQSFGIKDIEDLDLRGKNKDELYSVLSKKDIVLVNGGNTFYLLKYVRESGFDEVIKKLINEGKIYIGISAGSYITCPTIEHALWKNADRNNVKITDLTGLNLVPFLIIAHFEEELRAALEEEIRNTKYPSVFLYDGQAILVNNKSIKVIGKGKREFYNEFSEI